MKRKRLLGNAASAAIQTITSALLLFFLYRFLLQELGAEKLGVWAVVLAGVSIGRLTDMGFAGTALKFVAAALGEGNELRAVRLLQTAAFSIAIALGILLVVALPLIDSILHWALPDRVMGEALAVLPIALVSLLLSMVAGVFQSGIDACHRMYLKNILLIGGNILMIVLALILVPRHGLMGIAIAQCLQAAALMVGSWLLLRRLLPRLPLIPSHWQYAEFREMVGYATNFQIGMIAGLLFEPLTKILLARYGDLTLTAYFDMANQLVQKARAVIASAQQALVPEIASIRAENQSDRERLFVQAYGFSFLIVVPYFLGIALALPFISWVWIGHYQESFVIFGLLMSAGWLAASIGAVSYFYNLGTAELFWNTVNHVSTGLLNLSLGWLLGHLLASIGVALAAMLALTIPNLALNLLVFRRLGLRWEQTIPAGHRAYFLVLVLTAGLAGIAGSHFGWFTAGAASSMAAGACFACVLPLALLLDPQGRKLLARITTRPRSV